MSELIIPDFELEEDTPNCSFNLIKDDVCVGCIDYSLGVTVADNTAYTYPKDRDVYAVNIVHYLEIKKDFRRQGYGRQVVKALLSQFNERPWLGYVEPSAIEFWEKLGWVEVPLLWKKERYRSIYVSDLDWFLKGEV